MNSRFNPVASAALIFAAVSPGRTTKKRCSGIAAPGVDAPARQLGPDAFVRSAGTKTAYLPASSMVSQGFSRERGVVASVVTGGVGNVVGGAPTTPESTTFQPPLCQPPTALSRAYHCCWPPVATSPSMRLSAR